MNNRIPAVIIIAAFCFGIAGCNSEGSVPTTPVTPADAKGKELVAAYCQSCHLLPDPSMIDKQHWTSGVLPEMGPRLGVFSFQNQQYPSYRGDLYLEDALYPDTPLIDSTGWQKIIDYFNDAAPAGLDSAVHNETINEGLAGFRVSVSESSQFSPASGCVKIDLTASKPRIFRSDMLRRHLYVYDESLNIKDSLRVPVGVTDLTVISPNEIVACFVGELMPNIGRSGFVKKIFIDSLTGKMKQDTAVMFERLARPVRIVATDINNDQLTDYLVCEFGHMFGSLSLFTAKKNGGYDKLELQNSPGVINVQLDDYNKDGLTDIWALFTQGDERIMLFTNKGNGKFQGENILRFQPSMGSSCFELADMNGDGLKDIVYTAGDNGDFSQVLKPYHGVYVYINRGNNRFEQQYFYAVNGSFKAIARDFDEDGDVDIASIAYFADFARRPEEGFIYFENQGNLQLRPSTSNKTRAGRWLCMDAGDIDGNGTIDLVLGNMSVGPTIATSLLDWRQGPALLAMFNLHHSRKK